MNFKDLKPGYSLHILDKPTMTYTTERVTNVSLPHIDPKYNNIGMIVDITTDKQTYCTPSDTDIAYPADHVITTDRQHILREAEAIRATSEQALAQTDFHKSIIAKSNNLIATLDPTQREKQATEARFNNIETRFNNIESSIEKVMTILTKLAPQ